MVKLAVLVPVHNESANIKPFYDRASSALESLKGIDWQIVYLNDGSQDDSLSHILELRQKDGRVKIITLSRNFGYHSVLTAGLTRIESDLYAIADVDGEDPPELFSAFLKAINDGAQVAYGIRSNREEPWLIVRFRGLFYHINKWIADSPAVIWMGEFAMITRQVRDAVIKTRTTFPFLRSEIAHVGFKREGIPYFRAQRLHGTSHYRLWSMTKFAIGGFLSSSTFPLRMILYLAVFFGLIFSILPFVLHLPLRDYASLASVLEYYFVIFSVPVLALYLARTYRNSVGSPLYVIDENETQLS